MAKPKGGLTEWFGKGSKGDWVDIGAPKKDGKFQSCGRKSTKTSKRKYPKCVPRAKARSMSKEELKLKAWEVNLQMSKLLKRKQVV